MITHVLSALLALAVMLPVVVLLAWMEHLADREREAVECMPRQNTWPHEDVES